MIDHFDTQIQPEETKECQDYLDQQEYLSTIDRLDDEAKADMARVELIAAKMETLDSGPVKFN